MRTKNNSWNKKIKRLGQNNLINKVRLDFEYFLKIEPLCLSMNLKVLNFNYILRTLSYDFLPKLAFCPSLLLYFVL